MGWDPSRLLALVKLWWPCAQRGLALGPLGALGYGARGEGSAVAAVWDRCEEIWASLGAAERALIPAPGPVAAVQALLGHSRDVGPRAKRCQG